MLGEFKKLDRSEKSGMPVYFQLANSIKEQIEKRTLAVGELIASERKVALENDISVATVRKAYEELVQQGFLKRVQGKGTFVTGTMDRRKKIRYYPLAKGLGQIIEQPDSFLLDMRKIDGDATINGYLEIEQTQRLYRIERLLIYAEQPTTFAITYLPEKMFEDLEKCERKYFENYAFYIFLEEKYGIPTISHSELLSVGRADERTAGILRVEPGYPLLEIEKIICTHKEQPYEYRLSYVLTDRRKLLRYY